MISIAGNYSKLQISLTPDFNRVLWSYTHNSFVPIGTQCRLERGGRMILSIDQMKLVANGNSMINKQLPTK